MWCNNKKLCTYFFRVVFSIILLSLSIPAAAIARDVTFSWSANPETVDGYRLHYKTGSGGEPYNGVGATEGDSPVETGNVTSYTLRNLSDTETYYFALTAYLGTEESSYSTEVVLAPVVQGSGRSVSFAWTANPENVDGYRLYYKTGSSGEPYDGTGADEGDSPVDTGDVTTYTLNGLNETETYYFALTAYTGTDESDYTSELVLLPNQGNTAPIASNGSVTTSEDTAHSGQLPASDEDSDPLNYTIVSTPSKGSVQITDSSSGSFTYTPNANLNGSDSFTFKVNDGTVDSNTATMTVTISAVNDAPTSTGSSLSTTEDNAVSDQLSGSDIDGDTLSFSIGSNGTKGTAAITDSSTGAFTYTPLPNANGSDSFTFTVSDGTVSSSAATVNVSISAVNDAPTASNSTLTVNEDSSKSGVLNANDPDGDSLTYSITGNGSKGNAVITNSSTGAFTYTPGSNENGNDSFTFRVNDGSLNSSNATVNVTIAAVNDPPTASNSAITVDEDSNISSQLNANDIDGDSLTFSIVSNGSKGNAVITNSSSGAFTYTPSNNQSGSDTFTFKVHDGTIDSLAASVSVTISPVNDPPTANNASITLNENSVASGQLTGTDLDGDPLTYSRVANGSKGNAVINPSTGAFTYTPNQDANGSDSFSFAVNDGTVTSATAMVNVTINPVNSIPVASGSLFLTDEDTAYNGQLSGTDGDGDSLTYAIVTNGTLGTATVTNASNGSFTYTPNENASGSDSFTFRVFDGSVYSGPAMVQVTISGINDIPVANGAGITIDEDTVYTGQLTATDAENDTLTFSLVTNGTKGVATITDSSTGAYSYTPLSNDNGADSFTFKVNDGTSDSTAAAVNVTITAVNDQPVVASIPLTTDINTEATGQLPAFDQEGDSLTYSIVVNGSKGNAVITDQATGAFTYTPATDMIGEDTFTVKVNDGAVDSAAATISVKIFDTGTLTAVFGDNYGVDFPGTVGDTYADYSPVNMSTQEMVKVHSLADSGMQKIANTVLMKIDLSDIPAYATIVDAKLIMYQSGTSGKPLYNTSVHKIRGKNLVVNEATCHIAAIGSSWSAAPSGTTYNNLALGVGDIESQEHSQLLLQGTEYRTWNITAMAQDWVATPSSNFGLLIQGEETDIETGRVFASSENSNVALRPQVIVKYKLIPRAPQFIIIEELK